MSRLFYHVMQDNLGNLLFDVTGTMRLAGSGTLATIYGDEGLTVVLPNPMTNHPSFGSFKCFLGAGDYDFYMAKGGYTFETLTGVQGHGTMAQQDASAVAITGGTISNVTFSNVTLPLGTMAQQNANAVAITGGTATLYSLTTTGPCTGQAGFAAYQNAAGNASAFYSDMAAGGTNRWALNCVGSALSHLNGPLGLQRLPDGSSTLVVAHNKLAGQHGMLMLPVGGDTGALEMVFANNEGTPIGSISTTSSATAFNTSSDARLKHAVEAISRALERVCALNPVAFRWNADDSPGEGFLAHELQQHIPAAVTGEEDAVNEDGTIKAQGVDHSKIVPHLVGAVQELAAQVQTLLARLEAVEARA